MEKKDIRITKTINSLSNTMMRLLENKTFDNITVNDLCQEAVVSRSTFYLHFKDKYDLVIYTLDEERKKMQKLNNNSKNIMENLIVFLEKIKEKHSVYYNLFLGQTNRELNKMIQQYFFDFLYKKVQKFVDEENFAKMVTIFYASGMVGTIFWWIENEFHISPTDLAEFQFSTLKNVLLSL